MGAMLDYHSFSIHGDNRWYNASRITRWAPLVVVWMFILSVVEIILGAIWLVQLGTDMEIVKVMHTLIVPGLSFFNSVPSLHLHMLLRRNSPVMAMWFSFLLALVFFVVAVLLIASCTGNYMSVSPSLRDNLCQAGRTGSGIKGPEALIWHVMVACFLISFLLYATHGGMAIRVHRFIQREEAEKRARNEDTQLSTLNAEEMARARELWRDQARYEL